MTDDMRLTRRFAPRPAQPPGIAPRELGPVTLPADLPEAIRRYFAGGTGATEVPVVRSAAFWGYWQMRMGPFWVPGTHHVVYRFGESMRRHMRLYLFRLRLLRGEDTLDIPANDARTVIAGRVLDSGPLVVDPAAVVLWLDSLIFRSNVVLDPAVTWQELSNDTVRMTYPLLDRSGHLDVQFDSTGTRVAAASTLRRKTSKASTLAPWRVDVHGWKHFGGSEYPSAFTVTWEDDGRPWSRWNIEGVSLNPVP